MNGKTIILMLAAAMLLPLHSSAQDKPKVKSVDLTIPVPTPGMTLEEAREFQLKSATGDITVSSLDWDGDFVENDDGDMFFKDGFNYKVRLQFMVNPSGGYTTDYVFKNNDYYIDGTRIKATLNGVEARVLYSAPYFINIELIMKVGAGGANSDRAAAQRAKSDYELNKNSYRGSLKAYSIEKADLMCPDTLKASDIVNTIQGPYNIREVWLSDKVDIVTFVRTVFNVVRVNGYTPENSDIYYPTYSMLMYSSRATLFIPESAAADVKAIFTRPTWSYHTLFTVKTSMLRRKPEPVRRNRSVRTTSTMTRSPLPTRYTSIRYAEPTTAITTRAGYADGTNTTRSTFSSIRMKQGHRTTVTKVRLPTSRLM